MEEQSGKDQGIQMVGYLIAGLLFYGGIGWLVDVLFGTTWGLSLGLVLGIGLAIYVIVKRYGTKA